MPARGTGRPGGHQCIQVFGNEAANAVDGGGAQQRQVAAGSVHRQVLHRKTVDAAALGELLTQHRLSPFSVLGCLHVRVEGAEDLAPVLADGAHLDHIFPVDTHRQAHRDLPAARPRLEFLLEGGVDIAVKERPFPQVGDILATGGNSLADVTPETGHPVGGREGEAVAVVQRQVRPERLDAEGHRPVARPTDLLDRPDGLAHRLGRIHRGPLAAPAVQKQFRIATIESLGDIGYETARHLTEGGPAITVRILCHQRVQGQGIRPDHVPDIRGVLEPSFDLEGNDAGFGQFFQTGFQIVIFQGQDGFVAQQDAAFSVHQVIKRATGLDAFAAVGAPPVDIFRQPAVSAVAYAQCPVNEELHFALHGRADLPYRFKRELPLQDEALAAQRFEIPGPLHVADGALRGSVQRHGDVLPGGNPGLPDDESIRPRLLGAEHLGVSFLLLAVPPQSIVSHEHAYPEAMGVRA